MSLEMTMGRREAALDATAEQVEAEAAPVARLWLQDLLGVLLSSLLGALLFLH